MSQTAINLFAVSIFIMTISILLGPLFHLSPIIPAITTFSVLAIAAADTFTLQGKGGNVFLDWIASFSPQYRLRILHHEAGHFLVAHLLDIPVVGYTLSAWEALKQGQPGQGGVSFEDGELESQLKLGKIGAQKLDRYCTVWMAGIAAEALVFNQTEGGTDDKTKLAWLLTNLGFTEIEQKQRFYLLQAKTLLEENWLAYQALVEVMGKRASVVECKSAIAKASANSTQMCGM